MKKIIALVTLGIFIGTTGAFAVSKIFPDVPSDAWYAWAVRDLSDVGIIKGYADGTFRPSEKVNRAEMAVMLAQTIQYIKNGSVSPSPVTSQGIEFDGCGKLSSYKDQPWFSQLNADYAKLDTFENEVGINSDACLSKAGTTFVFIPEDVASGEGCGRIYEYLLDEYGSPTGPNNVLRTPSGVEYCATEFGKREGNYITFTGLESDDGGKYCYKHQGKYFYLENRVEVSKSDCQ